MAVKGVFLKDVPFYRQVEVSATSKMTTLDGGEVDLSEGDIVAVVGFRPQQKQCEGETRSAAQMRVVVFSGETREQVMECLVPGGAIVPGEMFGRELPSTTSYNDSGDDAKWVRMGGDGKYNLEATSKEMGSKPEKTVLVFIHAEERDGHVHDHQLPTPEEEMEGRRRRREEATVARAREDAWNLGQSKSTEPRHWYNKVADFFKGDS